MVGDTTDLIAIHYGNLDSAEEVRRELFKLQRQHLISFDDALVVTRDEGGSVKLNQLHDLTLSGALNGGFWGLLLGAVFTLPFFGPGLVALPFLSSLLGAGLGAVSGRLADIGVDDDFARDCGAAFQPGTSALFVLVRKATPDKVIEAIRPFGGKVLTTSLSREQEARIESMLTPIARQFRSAEQYVKASGDTSSDTSVEPSSRIARPPTGAAAETTSQAVAT